MTFRKWGLALFCVLAASAARAENWIVTAQEAPSRSFSAGEWTPARNGDSLSPERLLQAAGLMRLARGGETMALGGGAEIRIEGENSGLLRAIKGGFGVKAVSAAPVTVMTTYAAIDARDANFGLVVGRGGADLAVRAGVVHVVGLSARRSVDLTAGQSLRLGPETWRVEAAGAEAPAMLAAAGSPPAEAQAAPQASVYDRRPLGAIGKAEAKAPDFSGLAYALHLARVWLLGPDRHEPFSWTEAEDGEMRLKPVLGLILNLSGGEAAQFWGFAALMSLTLGLWVRLFLRGFGFRVLGNAGVVLVSFAVGLGVRDLFFRGAVFIEHEPYVSLTLMTAALPLVFVAAALAKIRLRPDYEDAPTIHTAAPSGTWSP